MCRSILRDKGQFKHESVYFVLPASAAIFYFKQEDDITNVTNNFSFKNTKTAGSLQVTLLEMICLSQFLEYQMQPTVKQFVQKSTGTWFSNEYR